MPTARLLAEQGFYPERETAREPALDRILANLGFWCGHAFSRRLLDQEEFAQQVLSHARRFRDQPPRAHVPGVRYKLRRDGFRADRLAECFGLCWVASGAQDTDMSAPTVLTAAALLVHGSIVEISEAAERASALALAATALAILGTPVHVVTTSDTCASRMADALRGPLGALGSSVACVAQAMGARERRLAYAAAIVCGAQRVLAMDYLRDRLLLGRRKSSLKGRLEWLASGAPHRAQTMLRGLHCALVEDADMVMLDDSRAPLVISADVDQARQRLLYEQALELARVLVPAVDFALGDEGAALTDGGSERLSQLVLPLGGEWLARQRRDELAVAALDALHVVHRDRDYRVEQGRVLFPKGGEQPADTEEEDPLLRCLVEVKEGCRLSGARDVLTRLAVSRFFRRYLHLGGVCADARRLEPEFWSLYSLRTHRCGPPSVPATPCSSRVFASIAARREALARAVRARMSGGGSVLLALRTQDEAQALAPMLADLADRGALRFTLHPAQRDAQRAAGESGLLHLVVGELHDAERHVAQIRKAYGAGTCEQFLAIEDRLVAAAVGWIAAAAGGLVAAPGGELPSRLAHWVAKRAQRGAERAQARLRRAAALRESQLDDLLAFSGQLD